MPPKTVARASVGGVDRGVGQDAAGVGVDVAAPVAQEADQRHPEALEMPQTTDTPAVIAFCRIS